MSSARTAFQKSHVVQYANFMPGEWLLWEDRSYLRGIHAHAALIGVGGPDLLPHRKGQRNHCLALLAARPAGVIGALAVQDGNLDERDPATKRRVTAAELLTVASGALRLDYLFSGTPHYTTQVLPLLRSLGTKQAP